MCDSQVNFDHMGIFNKKKGDLDGFDLVLIKAEFRQLFQDNAGLFFKKPEQGGLGAQRMQLLFGAEDGKEFMAFAEMLEDNPFYQFIKLQ